MKDTLSKYITKMESLFKASPPILMILNYHSISNDGTIVDVLPEEFEKQIHFLKSNFDVISLEEAVGFVRGDFEIKRPSVVLTFDDGYDDLLDYAAPILANHNIPSAVFVLSDPDRVNRNELENDKKLLEKDQIKKLQKLGWTIGCHSATHPDFLRGVGTEKEIRDAKKTLEKELGCEIKYFAYPKGVYNDKVLKAVKLAGFSGAFTTHWASLSKQTDLFRIPRIGVDRTHTIAQFSAFFTNWARIYSNVKCYFKESIAK